jgi:hypothetical protein
MKHMEFHTDDPVKLARELTGLEENVERAIREVVGATSPQAAVDSFASLGSATIAPLLPDHQLSIDTSQASAIAVLPAVASANFGRRFVLIKRVAANQISVSCSDPTATHNAGAFPVLAAAGARVFYCDAQGYYS